MTREFHQTDGQLRELKSTLATLDKQLNDKIYSEASHQWICKVAEWKSNKLACADLGQLIELICLSSRPFITVTL